ncbi:MAG: heavy metal translocating P-type ATPase [Caldithrix sp.]|nr:heavy metal translocating P-type ATPase [Caldithrix sp.]
MSVAIDKGNQNKVNTMSEKKLQYSLIPIEGMTCASCVSRVEKGLKDMNGAQSVNVNLATEQAAIGFENNDWDLNNLIKTVESTGYHVKQESTVLSAPGMQDTPLAQKAEHLVSRQTGVLQASANTASEQIHLTYIPGLLDFNTLKSELQQGVNIEIDISDKTSDLQQVLDAPHQRYARSLLNRVTLGVVLSIIIFIFSMPRLFGFIEPIALQWRAYSNFLLTAIVLIFTGKPFFTGFIKALRAGTADMNTLVALGSGTAFIYSTVVTIAYTINGWESASAHLFYDTAAMITTFILIGRYLEARAKNQTTSALRALASLQPKIAHRISGHEIQDVSSNELKMDDECLVRNGEHIPADGVLLDKEALIDESMLTGERLPAAKKSGDQVIGGTINTDNPIRIRILRTGMDTTLGRIIGLVRQAQGSKPDIQKLADKVAAVFVPIVIGIALLTFGGWFLAGASFTTALIKFITVVVVACPCAMGLATPTAIMVSSGRGAEEGILIKDAGSQEILNNIDVLLLDKTGTLTSGRMRVKEIVPLNEVDRNHLLQVAASLENHSNHPIARSIVQEAQNQQIELQHFSRVREKKGQGLKGTLDDQQVLIGKPSFVKEYAVTFTEEQESRLNRLAQQGATTSVVAFDGKPAGIIALTDEVKPQAEQLIRYFTDTAVQTILVTGDQQVTADAIAEQLGMDGVYAECSPERKAEIIHDLQANGQKVAMVGDGINDAVALTQADVGIAMGKGTDVAAHSADIILMNDELISLQRSFQLSRQTIRLIKQNLFWAFGYNVLMIPAAAGLLLWITGVGFDPAAAAVAMALSSFSVVSNSLRLKRAKIE